VSRALDVETCREGKINANLLSIFQLLPAEVRETERTTLNSFKIPFLFRDMLVLVVGVGYIIKNSLNPV